MRTIHRTVRLGALLLLPPLASAGCDLDLTDPNNPTEEVVVGSIGGILQAAVGLQAEYADEIVDPIYVTGLVTDEIGAGGATFEVYQQLDRGDEDVPNNLDPSEAPWAGQYDVIQIADVLLEEAPEVGMGEATLSGVLALARTYKAMALGNLLLLYERVPLDVGPDNVDPAFATREEGVATVMELFESARQQLATTPASDEFEDAVVAAGIDLPELVDAMTARYALAFERYDEALAAAERVDLSRMSSFSYSATDVNPLWNLWYNSGNAYQMRPEDRFRLDAEAGDQRVGFWIDEAGIEGAAVELDEHERYQGREAAIPAYLPDEMRLIMAEVHARRGELDEALDLVNEVRTQCSSPLDEPVACLPPLDPADVPTAEAVLAEILRQRRYELYLTGLRWSDLRRFGEPVKYEWVQVPRSECDRNTNAPQELCITG